MLCVFSPTLKIWYIQTNLKEQCCDENLWPKLVGFEILHFLVCWDNNILRHMTQVAPLEDVDSLS